MITVSKEGKIYDKNGKVYEWLKKYGKRGQVYYVSKYGASHRIIAEALIPNPDNKTEVDHINGDAKDNRPENLRWVTQEENKALYGCDTLYHIKNDKNVYVTQNLSKFCKYFNLDSSALRKTSMDSLAKDRRKQHKGYSICKKQSLDLEHRKIEDIMKPYTEIM